MMARKTKKSEDQKLAEEIGAALSDEPEAKPARKNAKAPKPEAKAKKAPRKKK
jgi:hypothetical protein